jgi:hypothetical protein
MTGLEAALWTLAAVLAVRAVAKTWQEYKFRREWRELIALIDELRVYYGVDE